MLAPPSSDASSAATGAAQAVPSAAGSIPTSATTATRRSRRATKTRIPFRSFVRPIPCPTNDARAASRALVSRRLRDVSQRRTGRRFAESAAPAANAAITSSGIPSIAKG